MSNQLVLISDTTTVTHTIDAYTETKHMSDQLAILGKVKVAREFRAHREWHERLTHNMYDFRVGAIKNVALRASYKHHVLKKEKQRFIL